MGQLRSPNRKRKEEEQEDLTMIITMLIIPQVANLVMNWMRIGTGIGYSTYLAVRIALKASEVYRRFKF